MPPQFGGGGFGAFPFGGGASGGTAGTTEGTTYVESVATYGPWTGPSIHNTTGSYYAMCLAYFILGSSYKETVGGGTWATLYIGTAPEFGLRETISMTGTFRNDGFGGTRFLGPIFSQPATVTTATRVNCIIWEKQDGVENPYYQFATNAYTERGSNGPGRIFVQFEYGFFPGTYANSSSSEWCGTGLINLLNLLNYGWGNGGADAATNWVAPAWAEVGLRSGNVSTYFRATYATGFIAVNSTIATLIYRGTNLAGFGQQDVYYMSINGSVSPVPPPPAVVSWFSFGAQEYWGYQAGEAIPDSSDIICSLAAGEVLEATIFVEV